MLMESSAWTRGDERNVKIKPKLFKMRTFSPLGFGCAFEECLFVEGIGSRKGLSSISTSILNLAHLKATSKL